MKTLYVLGALLALAGCKDYGKCLESHTTLMTNVVLVGKTPIVTTHPVIVCDKHEFPEGK